MLITKIERQKHNEKRFSVFADGEFKFGIDGVDLLYFKLEEGKEISEERYEYILSNVVYAKAKSDALEYLGYRAHTEKEIRDKLKSNEYTDDTVEMVLEFLKRYGYVNDLDYAGKYIRDKRRLNRWGSRKIKYELTLKGVSSSIIDEAMKNDEDSDADDDLENAIYLVNKKFGSSNELDYNEKRKAYNFLMRKGFAYTTINKALGKLGDMDDICDDCN